MLAAAVEYESGTSVANVKTLGVMDMPEPPSACGKQASRVVENVYAAAEMVRVVGVGVVHTENTCDVDVTTTAFTVGDVPSVEYVSVMPGERPCAETVSIREPNTDAVSAAP